MDLTSHFQSMARYNRIANERVYAACGALPDVEYRKPRAGSLGSIEGLLNHLLIGDRRWLDLFGGGQRETPKLNQILHERFDDLRAARQREDERIERFFAGTQAGFWDRTFSYINNQGKDYLETAPVACAHLFNHQTHHRGQVHVMLSQAGAAAPSLDLHRILNP